MRPITAIGLAAVPLLLASGVFDRNRPEVHEDIVEHFKYGSIGAEERAGVPYWIWAVMPRLFPEYLPQRPGEGYERFGFVFESSRKRPIGTSLRERQVPLIGLNCAVCHTGTLRETPEAKRQIILGMPAHQFDLQSFQRFMFRSIADPRFTPERVWREIRNANPEFGWFDSVAYRWFIIPETRRQSAALARNFQWFDSRPPHGPGRVDTFNPYKVMFGFDLAKDLSVGTADLPSLWNQQIREGMWLHWDGNNNSVTERNKSAAIGAGASESSLDLPAMKRVEDWIWTFGAPKFPQTRIDTARANAGDPVYRQHCASCHEPGGARVGQAIPLTEVGTDPERVQSFSAQLAAKMNTLGSGRPWKFSRFRETNGYAAMPLDGVWLRAPYLHNGSVPALGDLLEPPERRPAVFWRGYDVYDFENAGFVSQGAAAEREGFRFDTAQRGNGNSGHLYGTGLNARQKRDLLEYLKTL